MDPYADKGPKRVVSNTSNKGKQHQKQAGVTATTIGTWAVTSLWGIPWTDMALTEQNYLI